MQNAYCAFPEAGGNCLPIPLLFLETMPYTSEQIRERIVRNDKAASLTRAKLHEMRIKFHTVKRITTFNSPYISIPLTLSARPPS